jgi:hypothetical protein
MRSETFWAMTVVSIGALLVLIGAEEWLNVAMME